MYFLLFMYKGNQHDALHLSHRIVFRYLLLSIIFVFSCVLCLVTSKCLLLSERRRVVNEQSISFCTILQREATLSSKLLIIMHNFTRPYIPKTRIFLNTTIRIPKCCRQKKLFIHDSPGYLESIVLTLY